MIQYQILRANIIGVVGQTEKRITNEILDVKGLRETLKYRGIPNRKFFSVDFLAFVTYSVLLILCFLFYFWHNRKRKVTVIEIQLKKKKACTY